MNPLYYDREGGLWTTTNDGIIRLVLRPNPADFVPVYQDLVELVGDGALPPALSRPLHLHDS